MITALAASRRTGDLLRGLAAGWLREIRQLRRSPDRLLALITAPVLTLVFLAITEYAGRRDLAPFAVLAPALLALWQMALLTSGEIVASERDNGSLEALIAVPTSFAAVITGRVCAVTTVSLLGFAESWLAAALLFGVRVPILHPWEFAVTALVTAAATAGTALMMAAVFVASRNARTFQNSLSYPFYVLGGVLVPVSYLPEWIEPFSRLVFLSWSSDLLRDALAPAPIADLGLRLAMVALLGVAGFFGGVLLLRAALRRVRRTGSIGYA